MSDKERLSLDDVVEIPRLYRLQWEEVQNAYVLLYPEGMIKLNQTAGEILKRVDGKHSIGNVVEELETAFNAKNLAGDVMDFLETAYGQGWIRTKQA